MFIDLESAPLPLEILETRMPEFKANGTLKDPQKIEADLAAKKQAWLDDAALSPVTGRILVIGALVGETVLTWHGDEKTFLGEFWSYVSQAIGRSDWIIGFNIYRFDLPFLIKRSWALGVRVPTTISRYRYWKDRIIDLRDLWQCGDHQCHGGLDEISKFFGGPGKTGGGADFHKLWESDRPKALQYLKTDLELCRLLYERMCL